MQPIYTILFILRFVCVRTGWAVVRERGGTVITQSSSRDLIHYYLLPQETTYFNITNLYHIPRSRLLRLAPIVRHSKNGIPDVVLHPR